jgi:hypothetical protein
MRIRTIVVVLSLGLLAFGGFAAVRELTKPTPPTRVPAIEIDPEAGAEDLELDAAGRRELRERRRKRELRRQEAAARRGSSNPAPAAPQPTAAPPATGDDVSDDDDGGDE